MKSIFDISIDLNSFDENVDIKNSHPFKYRKKDLKSIEFNLIDIS